MKINSFFPLVSSFLIASIFACHASSKERSSSWPDERTKTATAPVSYTAVEREFAGFLSRYFRNLDTNYTQATKDQYEKELEGHLKTLNEKAIKEGITWTAPTRSDLLTAYIKDQPYSDKMVWTQRKLSDVCKTLSDMGRVESVHGALGVLHEVYYVQRKLEEYTQLGLLTLSDKEYSLQNKYKGWMIRGGFKADPDSLGLHDTLWFLHGIWIGGKDKKESDQKTSLNSASSASSSL